MFDFLFLRMYVETRLAGTRNSQESMRVLMDDCQCHFNLFFTMVKTLRDSMDHQHQKKNLDILKNILQDTVRRQVHKKVIFFVFFLITLGNYWFNNFPNDFAWIKSNETVFSWFESCLTLGQYRLLQIVGYFINISL